MKDFNVQIKVRNGRLLRLIREAYPSAAAFARATDLNQVAVSALVTMRHKPVCADGDWTDLARNVSAALGVYPEEIWPDHMRRLKAKRATSEVEMDAAQVMAISDSSSNVEKRLLLEHIKTAMSPREAKIVMARLEGATLAECGAEAGVASARIAQIEAKGLRKMRDRAKKMGVRSYGDVE